MNAKQKINFRLHPLPTLGPGAEICRRQLRSAPGLGYPRPQRACWIPTAARYPPVLHLFLHSTCKSPPLHLTFLHPAALGPSLFVFFVGHLPKEDYPRAKRGRKPKQKGTENPPKSRPQFILKPIICSIDFLTTFLWIFYGCWLPFRLHVSWFAMLFASLLRAWIMHGFVLFFSSLSGSENPRGHVFYSRNHMVSARSFFLKTWFLNKLYVNVDTDFGDGFCWIFMKFLVFVRHRFFITFFIGKWTK